MSEKTILVIDDSATIRRLVDHSLTALGYRVVLAPTAEEGLLKAQELCPDLILLDHQLPGTTGFEVCQQLIKIPELVRTPVVISSTLRKKAYVEYTDLHNVVDMLPKPYTAELLATTVANGLDTGAMIVASQTQGAAVPEVIHDPGEADILGTFRNFRLRELLDFLNHAGQCGVLEIDAGTFRVAIYLERGRVQAICGSGLDLKELTSQLPESLQSLAPVMGLTVGGKACAQLDSVVELLDRKVLDPRLLQKLLRHQAASLLLRCFVEPLKDFRFLAGRTAPALYSKLPLDISTLALLLDGAAHCTASYLPADVSRHVFARRAVRGQNLDRAGVAAKHLQLLSQLSEPQTAEQLATQQNWPPEEMSRVLWALTLADLVESKVEMTSRQVLAIEADPQGAHQLRAVLTDEQSGFTGRVVRDRLALQLVLRRTAPDVIIAAIDTPECRNLARELQQSGAYPQAHWIGIVASEDGSAPVPDATTTSGIPMSAVLSRPYTDMQVREVLERLASASRTAGSVTVHK